eukprot:13255690-Alexandrium_andersonii.AAC.1
MRLDNCVGTRARVSALVCLPGRQAPRWVPPAHSPDRSVGRFRIGTTDRTGRTPRGLRGPA